MNFLAHCALAGDDPEHLIGGFLGDFVKGPVPEHLPAGVQTGVRLHRRLDAYSAEQADIRCSVERLPREMRRLAPVFVDLLADHFLAIHFRRMHGESLADFERRAYRTLARYSAGFPPRAQRFFDYLHSGGVFSRYTDVVTVGQAFERVGERLGIADVAAPAMTALTHGYDAFEADFLRYYPALQRHSARWLASAAMRERS
jgi:acyl carrier protein phosphodiesterase